jgi:segregation and condensation protein B
VKIKLRDKIETILFIEAISISISKIAKKLKITESECLKTLKELKNKYRKEQSIFDIIVINDSAQLVVKKELTFFVKDYFRQSGDSNSFSPAMLEVLSIIVYKNPIKKAEIEKIRGVNCSLILRKLLIIGFINQKKSDSNTESFVYTPSLKLFRKMGISRLEDLPDYDRLSKELI